MPVPTLPQPAPVPGPSPTPGPPAGEPANPAPSPPPGPTPGPPPAPGVPSAPARPAVACGGVAALTAGEAEALARAAAAAIGVPLTVAVVDRPGNPLAVLRSGTTAALDDRAVGLARTGAFFSNDQAPLSSRTVRFVSGIHFPPGVKRTPNAALYGIENTNRGCDLRVPFAPGKAVPRPRALAGGRCDVASSPAVEPAR